MRKEVLKIHYPEEGMIHPNLLHTIVREYNLPSRKEWCVEMMLSLLPTGTRKQAALKILKKEVLFEIDGYKVIFYEEGVPNETLLHLQHTPE